MRNYFFTHAETNATTGYFACVPEEVYQNTTNRVDDIIALLKIFESAPSDTFLHEYILRELLKYFDFMQAYLSKQDNPIYKALLYELYLLKNIDIQNKEEIKFLYIKTHFSILQWALRENKNDIIQFMKHIRDNISNHIPLDSNLIKNYIDKNTIDYNQNNIIHISELQNMFSCNNHEKRRPLEETILEALDYLMDADFLDGPEYRHTSSLAPVGVFRHWPLDITVDSGILSYRLQGQSTSWGRGFSVAEARVSCVMEMVERISSYVSVEACSINEGIIKDRANDTKLIRSSYSELKKSHSNVIDPNLLPIAFPYKDSPLWWMQAEYIDTSPVFVPMQAVSLFSNLDEQSLYLPAISTGLATGNTMAEARRAALLEVLERDAEAVSPWRDADEFIITSSNPAIQNMLEVYASYGIYPRFRELKCDFGVPCYECFVIGSNGECVRATGAHLSAQRAILSALTEVPWAFPNSQITCQPPKNVQARVWEDLPDYSTGSTENDVYLLDTLLSKNGCRPAYAELTRSDLHFPVVRAIVPHLELSADTDIWSKPSDRLIRHILDWE